MKHEHSRSAWQARSVIESDYAEEVKAYLSSGRLVPLLLHGDARCVLDQLPASSIDFAMTSPPYWGKREYEGGGIGQEGDYREFIRHLSDIFLALKRVLKPEGSFWLNIGDTYQDKGLLGIPWRVALELTDRQGWILRNSVIWNCRLSRDLTPFAQIELTPFLI